MLKILKLTAEEILEISIFSPEEIFSRDNFEMEFIKLRGKWHPDVNANPLATDVFTHIMQLAETAKGLIMSNSWNGLATLRYETSEGKTFRFTYRKFKTFELGKMYIGQKYILYVIDHEYKEFYDNGIRAIKNIKYPATKFKKEFENLLPKIIKEQESEIGYVLVIEKPKGSVLLQDLLDLLPNNTLPPEHTAWVTSSMCNIAMFLDHTGITHNSLTTSSIFVNTDKHSCHVLGGWWYSVKAGNKLKAMPSELIKILPKKIFDDKIAKTCYDRQAVKSLAIKCLGDKTLIGSKLLFDKNIPKPFVNWIRSPASDSALEEYTSWVRTLEKSYGKRKFSKFKYNIDTLK